MASIMPKPCSVAVDDGRPLILFDAVCGLCNGFVKFVTSQQTSDDQFRFEPLQSEVGRAQLTRFGLPHDLSTVVLVHRGRHWVRSAAALNVMWLLGYPWAMLYVFVILPTPLRDAAYKWIAANRYRLFGTVGGEADAAEVAAARARVEALVAPGASHGRVVVFSKSTCPFCRRAKALLADRVGGGGSSVLVEEVDARPDGAATQAAIKELTGRLTVPAIFVGGQCLGGFDELRQADTEGRLAGILAAAGVPLAASATAAPASRL